MTPQTKEHSYPGEDKKKSTAIYEIEKARKQGANLLLPTTNVEGLSDFHAPVIDSVYLSSNDNDGDVYPAKGGDDVSDFRITAQGLRKLSVCAGVMWHPYECRRIDNRSDRDYVAYQAMGGIRKADGTPVWWKGEYDIDFEVIEEELTEQYRQKCKNWKKPDDVKQGYIDSSVKRDLIFKRKHKIKLAETGAMNRVIRAILGLKNSYTTTELSKPFVMVRIVLRPDYNDKDVRKQMVDAAIKSMTGVYGPEIPQTQPTPTPGEDIIDIPPGSTDEDYVEEAPEPDEDYGGQQPTEEEIFSGYTKGDQIKTLKELAKKKNYDLNDLNFTIEQFTKKHRMDFFTMLSGMPEQAVDDDIPF